MAYSILIADDEAMMRNGLKNLIKWHEMDFEVVDVVEDGQYAIDYLASNPVDVLLTDIRMGSVSGLDVAKYISEHNLPVKTVIISGYKDFEYAREALRYGVSEYLLKPLSMPALRQTFSRLHGDLDAEIMRCEQQSDMIERYQALCENAKAQFYVELATGALSGQASFDRRVRLLGLGSDEINCRCCLVSIRAIGGVGAINDTEVESIAGTLQMLGDNLAYYITAAQGGNIKGLFVEKRRDADAPPWIGEAAKEEFALNAERVIRMLSGKECKVSVLGEYDSLGALMTTQRASALIAAKSFRDGGAQKLDYEYFGSLRAMKHLIMSYIVQHDSRSAMDELDAFFDMATRGGVLFATNQLIHLFSTIIDKCDADDMTLKNDLQRHISLVELANRGQSEQRHWAHEQLTFVFEQMESHLKQTDPILKAQDYVRQRYMNDLSLNEIAENVHLNPAYFSRLFKERSGKTYIRFLTEVRMHAAAEMLRNTDTLVYDICHSVGYTNLNHFYKLFRKIMGCSPSEYRERNIVT